MCYHDQLLSERLKQISEDDVIVFDNHPTAYKLIDTPVSYTHLRAHET